MTSELTCIVMALEIFIETIHKMQKTLPNLSCIYKPNVCNDKRAYKYSDGSSNIFKN